MSAEMPADGRLQGRRIAVVGASGGIGSALTGLLAAAGADLTLVGRDAGRLTAVRDGRAPGSAVLPVDIRLSGSAEQIVAAASDAAGVLDGLVVASGVVAFGGFDEVPDGVAIDLFTTNVLAPMRLLRAASPALRASAAAGHDPFALVVSAVVAEQPMPGLAAYSASKAAITAFDEAAGRELRRAGIRLIDARPPHTETGLVTRALHGQAPRLPEGLTPEAVAARLYAAIVDGVRTIPSSDFG